MNPTFFLSPAKLIWGASPAFVIPTATSTILGPGKLRMMPSVVLLTQPPHWTIGVLINNVWSVAGSEHRPPVNQMPLQYFLNYNLKKGWYLQMTPIIGAGWRCHQRQYVDRSFLFPKLFAGKEEGVHGEQLKKLEQQEKSPQKN